MPAGGRKYRRKGVNAELEVVKLLQKHWPTGTFRRSGPGFQGKDIVTPEGFPFTVEVKHRRDIKVKHLWYPNAVLKQCLKQAVKQAAAENKPFLLFVKSEGVWWVIVEPETLDDNQFIPTLHHGDYDVYSAEDFLTTAYDESVLDDY